MNCSECKDLCRTFEEARACYLEARSAAFYQVSTTIAVRNHIHMERALNDLREHQEVCPWAMIVQYVGHSGVVAIART